MPSFSTIRDNFENNTIDSLWATATSGSATVQETTGQARITLPSSTAGTHEGYYQSTAAYDLTGDSFYVNIGTMVATGVAASAYFDLLVSAGSGNTLRWIQTSGTIKAQTIVAGVATDRYSAAWSSSTYKYLRIRESGGNVLFDSSSNGTSWTNRASVAAPFAVTSLFVRFGASCGNVASPGSFRLDDVNLILPALSTTWRYTEAERPYITRIGSVTISATSGHGYLATAEELDASGNLVSPRYFSGPIGSASGGYLQLTEYTAQADAQAMAVNLPADGRWDLPGFVQASVVRLYHRSTTGSTYRIDEYYPRRLVQADDIEAESITALNIAANTITADKIAVLELDALHYITAGAGVIRLDDSGITIEQGAGTAHSITWYDDFATEYELARVNMQISTNEAQLTMQSFSPVGGTALAGLSADVFTGVFAEADGATANRVSFQVPNVGDSVEMLVGVSAATALSFDVIDTAPTQVDMTLLGNIKPTGVLQPGGVAVSYTANLQTIANNAAVALGMSNFGFALIAAGGVVAMYAINGTLHTTTEIFDPSGVFSPTAGTASSWNVYWSAGNSRYELENKRGSTANARIWLLDAA